MLDFDCAVPLSSLTKLCFQTRSVVSLYLFVHVLLCFSIIFPCLTVSSFGVLSLWMSTLPRKEISWFWIRDDLRWWWTAVLKTWRENEIQEWRKKSCTSWIPEKMEQQLGWHEWRGKNSSWGNSLLSAVRKAASLLWHRWYIEYSGNIFIVFPHYNWDVIMWTLVFSFRFWSVKNF